MAVREAERRDLPRNSERRAELATWGLLWTLELLASSLYIAVLVAFGAPAPSSFMTVETGGTAGLLVHCP